MFIALPKGLFDKDIEEEMNKSFQYIDSAIDSLKPPDIWKTVIRKNLRIDGAKENHSFSTEESVTLLFSTDANSCYVKLTPLWQTRLIAVGESGKSYGCIIDTSGKISIDVHEGDIVWISASYVIAYNK